MPVLDILVQVPKESTSEIITDETDVDIVDMMVSNDPSEWINNDFTINYLLSNGINQNLSSNFISSERKYSNKVRYLSKNLFKKRLKNGEQRRRYFLVYSEKKVPFSVLHVNYFL